MPEDPLNRLVELADVTAVVGQPAKADWERLETETRLRFPTDYKSMLDKLGSGEFGAGLRFLSPRFSMNCDPLSHRTLKNYREAVGFLEARMSIAFYPEPGGLVWIGGIDRQQFFYASGKGSRNLKSLIYLDHDLEQLSKIGSSLSEFLVHLYLDSNLSEMEEDLKTAIWHDDSSRFFTGAAV